MNCLQPEKKTDRAHLNFRLAHVTLWSAPICDMSFLMWARMWQNKQTDHGLRWMCTKNFPPFGNDTNVWGHWCLSGGGDVSTEFYTGRFKDIGWKYKMSGLTVSKIWKTFCQTTRNYSHRHTAEGQLKKLDEPQLDLVQPQTFGDFNTWQSWLLWGS